MMNCFEDNYEFENSNKEKFKLTKRIFSKVFDFFNYKPLDDFSSHKFKKERLTKIKIK